MSAPLTLIVHLDADAFFVSVEQALDPSLRGKLVAVGGRERGIIASASYEARARGVYTPMPTVQALKICPGLILANQGHERYGEFSQRMFDLCETLTPWVQRNSIDEGYLDLGPCGFRSAAEIERRVRALQQRIWDDLQITASFGLAANKLVAAIASKAHKPRGFTVVPPGQEAAYLAPLKIGVIPGVGKKAEARLEVAGLRLVRDLFTRTEAELRTLFGRDWEEVLAMGRGEDHRPVETEHEEAKSFSQQVTFAKDLKDFAEIEKHAKRMVDELLPSIRADGKRARTLTVKVRYPGMEDRIAVRSLFEASDLESDFYPLLGPLLRQAWTQRKPLRLVGVKFSGITAPTSQLEMFGNAAERRRRLAAVVDLLNAASARVQHGHQLPMRQIRKYK